MYNHTPYGRRIRTTWGLLTQRAHPQVEAGPGDLGAVDVRPAERPEPAAHGPGLGVARPGGLVGLFGGAARPATAPAAAAAEGGAVVEEHGDVDAHYGDDAAHVEIHHEVALSCGGSIIFMWTLQL